MRGPTLPIYYVDLALWPSQVVVVRRTSQRAAPRSHLLAEEGVVAQREQPRKEGVGMRVLPRDRGEQRDEVALPRTHTTHYP